MKAKIVYLDFTEALESAFIGNPDTNKILEEDYILVAMALPIPSHSLTDKKRPLEVPVSFTLPGLREERYI